MFQNVKVLCFSVILLFCILFSGCSFSNSQEVITAGMTYADFIEVVPEEQFFMYLDYAFFSDADGNPYVVRFENEKIAEYRMFSASAIDRSADTFSGIQTGVSLFELVGLIGLPVDTGTFGMPSLLFESSQGDRYTVYLDTTNPHDLRVAEVTQQDTLFQP